MNIDDLKAGDTVYVEELFTECNSTRAKFVTWADEHKARAVVKVGCVPYTVERADLLLR